MPLTRLAADAFGVVTISLVSLLVILSLLCLFYLVYFHSRIRRQGLLHLGYFNGPWLTRITFILVAIWWGFGEIIRLSLLKGIGRLFTNPLWQKNICKFYILSNIGFAEPSLFLTLMFLLHASVQKRESGTLSRRWNRKTIGYVLICCLPMFLMQLGVVFVGPNINNERKNRELKIPNYFTRTSTEDFHNCTCTYPLMSTIILGLFDILVISYVSYLGVRIVSLVINKGLRRRICILVFSVILCLLLRFCLLGFSVIPNPGSLAYEAVVFMAFLMLLICILVGICMLVYYPVADSLALRGLWHTDIPEMPFDDYYDSSALIANQSYLETGRNSDASTKRGSISFRTMIRDDSPATTEVFEEVGLFTQSALRNFSPPGSPMPTMVPLQEFSKY